MPTMTKATLAQCRPAEMVYNIIGLHLHISHQCNSETGEVAIRRPASSALQAEVARVPRGKMRSPAVYVLRPIMIELCRI